MPPLPPPPPPRQPPSPPPLEQPEPATTSRPSLLLLLLLPAESVGLLLACLAVISLLASRKVLLRELARLRAQKTVIQYLTLNPMLTVWQVSNPDGENMIGRPAWPAEVADMAMAESADGDGEATVPGSPSTASAPSTPGSALSRYAPWRIFRRSARVQPDSSTGDSSDVSPAAEGTELSSPA